MTNKITGNPWLICTLSLAFVVTFYVLREHWRHLLGYTPYLLLLGFPLLHLMHGHGGHRHRDGSQS